VPVCLQVAVIVGLVDVVVVVGELRVGVFTLPRPRRRELGGVEVGAEFGPVEVDVVVGVAGQVGPGRVDRHEVGVVEPAGPLRVERVGGRGPPGAPGRQFVDRAVLVVGVAVPGRDDRIGCRPFLVLLLLDDGGIGYERILVVFVFPVFVVLEAHAVTPRPGAGRSVSSVCRIMPPSSSERPPTTLNPPVPGLLHRADSGGCGRLTTYLRTAPPPGAGASPVLTAAS
jgi:hypothetical protein